MFNADNDNICCNLEQICRLATESIHDKNSLKKEIDFLKKELLKKTAVEEKTKTENDSLKKELLKKTAVEEKTKTENDSLKKENDFLKKTAEEDYPFVKDMKQQLWDAFCNVDDCDQVVYYYDDITDKTCELRIQQRKMYKKRKRK